MTPDDSSLGHCPDCGEEIPPEWAIIDYEKEDGTNAVWAECPACDDVVDPQ